MKLEAPKTRPAGPAPAPPPTPMPSEVARLKAEIISLKLEAIGSKTAVEALGESLVIWRDRARDLEADPREIFVAVAVTVPRTIPLIEVFADLSSAIAGSREPLRATRGAGVLVHSDEDLGYVFKASLEVPG